MFSKENTIGLDVVRQLEYLGPADAVWTASASTSRYARTVLHDRRPIVDQKHPGLTHDSPPQPILSMYFPMFGLLWCVHRRIS